MRMLCLRFFSCLGCETVYADVESPPTCDVCAGDQFEKLNVEDQAMSYFS
jgi:rubredoxin